ncbi:hypothetical protein HC891_11560 [Candidatus Gracilibacteria bacterium]|nr:hypothetical protein [Candidatus Gracilibacteria bacterium]
MRQPIQSDVQLRENLALNEDVEPYLFDVKPQQLRYELIFAADKSIELVEIYGEELMTSAVEATVIVNADGVSQTMILPSDFTGRDGDAVLLHRHEVLDRTRVPLAEAPQALRDGNPPQARFVADYRNNENYTRTVAVRTISIEEAAAQVQPLFVFPDSPNITRTLVLGGERVIDSATIFIDGLDNIVGRGLAVRQQYLLDIYTESPLNPAAIDLVQGPIEPIMTYLRGRERWERLYEGSEPYRLLIAGVERDAWLMSGRQTSGISSKIYLFVEIDGTLLIVQGGYRPLDQIMLDALAQLEPYTTP